MEKGLVSIVIPCYNGEKYISNCLNSLVNQTYEKIQVIIINDGSKDTSLKIMKSYEKKFKDRKKSLIIIDQENQGQASAVNNGLKLVTGEYLAWIDIDDYYEEDGIENMVEYLKKHKDCVAVRGESLLKDENDLEKVILHAKSKYPNETNIFDFYIYETDSYGYSGIFLVRMSHFEKRIKDREIYTSRAGQNWQLILPIAYKSNIGYLDKVVHNYRFVDNSHSRSVKNTSKLLSRCDEHMDILYKVLLTLDMTEKEREKHFRKIKNKYTKKKLRIILGHLKRKVLSLFNGKDSK